VQKNYPRKSIEMLVKRWRVGLKEVSEELPGTLVHGKRMLPKDYWMLDTLISMLLVETPTLVKEVIQLTEDIPETFKNPKVTQFSFVGGPSDGDTIWAASDTYMTAVLHPTDPTIRYTYIRMDGTNDLAYQGIAHQKETDKDE
jgi:hypothetical protein